MIRHRDARPARRLLAILLAAAATTCGPERAEREAPDWVEPTPGRADTPPPVPRDATQPERAHEDTPEAADPSAPGSWTIGTADVPSTASGASGVPVVRTLRTGTHEGHDRVTVELDTGEGMPGYRLEYIDKPLHECGSGREIHPLGDAWLELRLEPAQAHTEAGEATLPGRELPVRERLLRRIYVTCDFEAVVSLVIAVASPNAFRAFTLEDPRRIVVDVRH